MVGEANFAGNAFTFYNGVSPYNAVYGRQPQCLPDLENFDFRQEGTNNRGERETRIRRASIEAITQATAMGKIATTDRAKISQDGRTYNVGDNVDYFRKRSGKDENDGWHGPFKVVENYPSEGHLKIQIQPK